MSWSQLELVLKTRHLWNSPAQFAVMVLLAARERESRGFSFPHRSEVAAILGVGKRRVSQLYEELEAMDAITRLGQDWEEFSGRNRYVLTVDKAVARRRGERATKKPGRARRVPVEGVQPIAPSRPIEAVISTAPLPAADFPLGSDLGCTQGCSQDHTVQIEDVLSRSLEPVSALAPPEAAAQPRLPTPWPIRSQRPLHEAAVAEARRLRERRLRNRVAGIARGVLLNPELARQVLNGEDPSDIGAFVEAVKRICAKKRVVGYADVVDGVCASEQFKYRNPDVINGTAARPRDLARRRAR